MEDGLGLSNQQFLASLWYNQGFSLNLFVHFHLCPPTNLKVSESSIQWFFEPLKFALKSNFISFGELIIKLKTKAHNGHRKIDKIVLDF